MNTIKKLTNIHAKLNECKNNLAAVSQMFSKDMFSPINQKFTDKQKQKIEKNIAKTRRDVERLSQQFSDVKIQNSRSGKRFSKEENHMILEIASQLNSIEFYNDDIDKEVFGKVVEKKPTEKVPQSVDELIEMTATAGAKQNKNAAPKTAVSKTTDKKEEIIKHSDTIYITGNNGYSGFDTKLFDMVKEDPELFRYLKISTEFSESVKLMLRLSEVAELPDGQARISDIIACDDSINLNNYTICYNHACDGLLDSMREKQEGLNEEDALFKKIARDTRKIYKDFTYIYDNEVKRFCNELKALGREIPDKKNILNERSRKLYDEEFHVNEKRDGKDKD